MSALMDSKSWTVGKGTSERLYSQVCGKAAANGFMQLQKIFRLRARLRLTAGPLLKTKLMPSIAAIARHWGTSPQYASKLKKRGCPTHSLKAADAWREANASRRESPNGVLKPARNVKAGRPWKFPEPSKTGDSLLDALNNSVATADMAFMAYKDALLAESPTSAARLSDHSKATQAMLQCNKFYREEQERRSILVPKQVIIEGCRKAMEVVLRMLNKLPSEQGPQCNPENPIMAMKVLQRKADEIKVATQAAISTMGAQEPSSQ